MDRRGFIKSIIAGAVSAAFPIPAIAKPVTWYGFIGINDAYTDNAYVSGSLFSGEIGRYENIMWIKNG